MSVTENDEPNKLILIQHTDVNFADKMASKAPMSVILCLWTHTPPSHQALAQPHSTTLPEQTSPAVEIGNIPQSTWNTTTPHDF